MFGLFRRRANAAVPPEVIRARLPSIVWMLAGEYRGARLVANRDHPICKDRQICKDRDTNIMDVWVGTRLEAVSQLWLSGLGKLELIINPRKQLHLLHSILDLHPFFGWPEPTGDDIKDTISSICRVYDYLHRLETETWAPLHEQPQGSVDLTKYEPAVQKSVMEHTAKRAKYEISEYASFIIEMHKLVPKWEAYEFAINAKAQLPDPPETVFGALWRDATFRAKMIALCALLWPAYTHAWRQLRQMAIEAEGPDTRPDRMMAQILSADDPDEIQQTPYSIRAVRWQDVIEWHERLGQQLSEMGHLSE